MDPQTPHPPAETPERHHPSSASPPTTTKRTNALGGSTCRITLANMGVHKRSGSGVGSRALAVGGGSRSQAELLPITDGMTKEEKEFALGQNKQIEAWMDDRARNNISAKRSRLKKMMYIVDMDNSIKEYAHNVMEFKQAYDACKAVIIRHNLQSELSHGFVEPVLWQRPAVMREQENDVADHRARLEKEAERKDLYELGFPFAEKLRALVNKTGAADRSAIAKALEEHRQKVEECVRKEAQYDAQMKEHERKAAEMKVKIQEVQKQQEEYRIASEKYGGGRAKQDDAMDLDPVPTAVPAVQALAVPQVDGPFVAQGPNPLPPARQGAPNGQDGDDFAQKGKTEAHNGTFHPVLPATIEENQAQKELEDEVEQWAQSQVDIMNPDLFGEGYDGLPSINFQNQFGGFDGETPFYNHHTASYTTPQQSSPIPTPITEGLTHGGNVTNANPMAGNPNNHHGSLSDLNHGGASAYGKHWSADYQRHPPFSPPAPMPFLSNTTGSGQQHGLTLQSHARTQPQHQHGSPVWDPMQNGYNGEERIFGDNFDA